MSVTCNVAGRQLEIDMAGGNQRDYYARFWTTYITSNGTWSTPAYRGGLWLHDDQTYYTTGPDVTISASGATFAVYATVTYPNGAVSFESYINTSYYSYGAYGRSQSSNYGGRCQM